MNHDNPADRLLAIILEGKKYPGHEGCLGVWQRIFGTSDNSTILTRLGLTADLPRQVVVALREANPNRTPTWNHWFPQIVNAFTRQQLTGQWQTFIGVIDQHSIDGLQSAAGLLEHITPKSLIGTTQLDELKEKLTEVLQEVRDSVDIDAKLKKIILKAVSGIINAIDQYFIEGVDGIAEAVEKAAGAVARNDVARQFIKKEGLGRKVLGALKLVNGTVDSTETVKDFGENAHEALEWLNLI